MISRDRDDLGGAAKTDPVLWLTVDCGGRTLQLIADVEDARYVYELIDHDAFRFIRTASGRKVNRRYVVEARVVPRGGY